MSSSFNRTDPPATLTVSELTRKVRLLLEGHFDFIWVEGEVSNFAAPSSGHWYFSLKDSGSQVRCAMFRNRNQRVRFRPANGDHLRLRCRVSLYEGRGEFQLIVEHAEQAGAGALQAAFEALKAKLLAEGLFDASRKKALPESISRLGVVTSPTGAAIHDILTVLQRRCPAIEVYILPVPVQGEGAAAQIAAAIERANRLAASGEIALDALIVGRGGGSLEDLWAFNEEVVARAIAASALPVVSAVGHEVDFSIADMAADQRAPTPSAAAEMLSPDQREQLAQLGKLEAELRRSMRRRLEAAATRLDHLRARLRHPGARLQEQAQRLDEMEQRLLKAQHNLLARKRAEVKLLASQLQANSPAGTIQGLQRELKLTAQGLERGMRSKLHDSRQQVAHLAQVLDSLSPLRTLARGYSILTDTSGGVIASAAKVSTGDQLEARLASGRLELKVEATYPVAKEKPGKGQ